METPAEEPATIGRTRSRRRVVVFVLALGALVLAAPFTSSTVRTNVPVRWLAFRMGSEDRAVREKARRNLAELGRPAIDSVLPDLVASAVLDASPPGKPLECWVFVFVGRVIKVNAASHTETYEIERWLPGSAFQVAETLTVDTGSQDSARSVTNVPGSELVVARYKFDSGQPHESPLTIHLGEDRQAVVEAVVERLRALDVKGR